MHAYVNRDAQQLDLPSGAPARQQLTQSLQQQVAAESVRRDNEIAQLSSGANQDAIERARSADTLLNQYRLKLFHAAAEQPGGMVGMKGLAQQYPDPAALLAALGINA